MLPAQILPRNRLLAFVQNVTLLAASALASLSVPLASAGSYGTQAFTFADGTTSLGDGSTIASSNGAASVQSNALRLTANGTGSTTSSFKLPDLDPAKLIQSFD